MNEPTPSAPNRPALKPLTGTHTVILTIWAAVLLYGLIEKLSWAETATGMSPAVNLALEIALTAIFVVIATTASTMAMRLFAYMGLIASAFDGAIDLPRALIEMQPAWFTAEAFFVALPVLVWFHSDRIATAIARIQRR